jgi:hypothetical protein
MPNKALTQPRDGIKDWKFNESTLDREVFKNDFEKSIFKENEWKEVIKYENSDIPEKFKEYIHSKDEIKATIFNPYNFTINIRLKYKMGNEIDYKIRPNGKIFVNEKCKFSLKCNEKIKEYEMEQSGFYYFDYSYSLGFFLLKKYD